MTSQPSLPVDLSDHDLLVELEHAASVERHATARLIALLMEVDSRKLYAGQGCSSLFTYCVQRLHLSEHAAYPRIEAARSARRFAMILDRLADGSLHLTAVGLLGPHLTVANHVELLNGAFRGEQGRCAETGFLEFHHVRPDADGGEASVDNIQLRCRTHNQHEADLWSGEVRAPHVRETRAEFSA